MIDKYIIKACDAIDKFREWMNNLFISKKKKKKDA